MVMDYAQPIVPSNCPWVRHNNFNILFSFFVVAITTTTRFEHVFRLIVSFFRSWFWFKNKIVCRLTRCLEPSRSTMPWTRTSQVIFRSSWRSPRMVFSMHLTSRIGDCNRSSQLFELIIHLLPTFSHLNMTFFNSDIIKFTF